jgi:hypothetical protein
MTSSSSSRSPSRNKGESALRIVFGYLERKEKKKMENVGRETGEDSTNYPN